MKRLSVLLAASLLLPLGLRAEDKALEPAPTAPQPPPATLPLQPAPAATEPAPFTPQPLVPPGKDPDRLELIPSKPAQLLPPPPDMSLIPPMPSPPEKKHKDSGGGGESPIKPRKLGTAEAEDQIKERIHLRELKTQAIRDPAVQAEWDASNAAKTDYDKREALKRYYTALYARMAKIDVQMKPKLDLQLQLALGRLAQNRIEPTHPLEPVADAPRAKR